MKNGEGGRMKSRWLRFVKAEAQNASRLRTGSGRGCGRCRVIAATAARAEQAKWGEREQEGAGFGDRGAGAGSGVAQEHRGGKGGAGGVGVEEGVDLEVQNSGEAGEVAQVEGLIAEEAGEFGRGCKAVAGREQRAGGDGD